MSNENLVAEKLTICSGKLWSKKYMNKNNRIIYFVVYKMEYPAHAGIFLSYDLIISKVGNL